MADFYEAFAYLAPLEGGYVDDPADRGGATKYGISLRFYKENADQYANEEDIQDMTLDQAEELYREFFWDALSLDRLDSQPVADKVFAQSVHSGLRPAVRILQRALNHSNGGLVVDGVLGPLTLHAANGVSDYPLVQDFELETLRFQDRVIARRPALERFRQGWGRRALA